MAKIFFLILLVSFAPAAWAQSSPEGFTVEAYTRLVLDASPEVRQARESFDQLEAQHSSQRAAG